MRVLEADRPGDDERDQTIRTWRRLAIERGEFCPLAHERRLEIMAARVARGVGPWGALPTRPRSTADVLREGGCVEVDLLDRAAVLDRAEAHALAGAVTRRAEPEEIEDLVEDDAGAALRVLMGGPGAA